MKKILVIGCGSIGQRHIRALVANGIQNIAALRTGKGQIKELADDIKEHVSVFFSEEEAFAWDPEYLLISNPTNLHIKYLAVAIEKGLKVFVEKPVIDHYGDLDSVSLIKKDITSYPGLVGYNLRFNGVFTHIKEILRVGEYGEVITGNLMVGHYLPFYPYEDYRESYAAQKKMGGGVLRTLSHELDLALFFWGGVKKVFAKVDQLSDLEMDADDTVDIVLEMDDCRRVLIHLDFLNPVSLRKGSILFKKGLLEYDYFKGEIHFTDYEQKTKELIYSTDEAYDAQYKMQMKHFLEDSHDIGCTLFQGIEVMEIIDACEKSSKDGREICFD